MRAANRPFLQQRPFHQHLTVFLDGNFTANIAIAIEHHGAQQSFGRLKCHAVLRVRCDKIARDHGRHRRIRRLKQMQKTRLLALRHWRNFQTIFSSPSLSFTSDYP